MAFERAEGIIEELQVHVFDELVNCGIEPDAASSASSRAAARIADHLGGSSFYLPRNLYARLAARDEKIRAEFDGRNAFELSRKYGLSQRRIEQIIDRYRGKKGDT